MLHQGTGAGPMPLRATPTIQGLPLYTLCKQRMDKGEATIAFSLHQTIQLKGRQEGSIELDTGKLTRIYPNSPPKPLTQYRRNL
jgi:hypothetical protein